MLRFDGLYMARLEEDDGVYNAYLRFYEDGTVLSCLSCSQPHEVERWLDKEHPIVSRGRWRWKSKNSGELFFSTLQESFTTVTTPERRTRMEKNWVVNDCCCTLAGDALEVSGRSFWHSEG